MLKNEIKRYLGYKNAPLDKNTDSLIESCLEELLPFENGMYIYDFFDISINQNVHINNSNLTLLGSDIKNHLSHSRKVAFLAATLGMQVDFLINKYNKINLSRAIVLDACATALIEKVCDNAQHEILKIAQKEGKKITPRFSPGYGDLPIECQPDIIKLLKADKFINLTSTKESVLIPSKSVTAIIGFSTRDIVSCTNKCLTCNNQNNCNFKRQ